MKIDQPVADAPREELARAPNQLDVQHWYRRVYARCQSLLLSPTDTEDATQETFVRALACLPELRSMEAIHGWLRNIARNVCIDMIRKNQIRRAQSVDNMDIPANSLGQNTSSLNRAEDHEHIMHHIGVLPEELREILLLHYYEEMSYQQMAQWLGVARSTVNDRLSRARQMLKHQLCSEKSR